MSDAEEIRFSPRASVAYWISLFWSLLVDGVGLFKAFVVDYYVYVKPRNVFLPGSDGKSIFAQPMFLSNVWF